MRRAKLELLDIDKDTQFEVRTDGEALIIRPAREGKKTRVREATARMMKTHGETLCKLAK